MAWREQWSQIKIKYIRLSTAVTRDTYTQCRGGFRMTPFGGINKLLENLILGVMSLDSFLDPPLQWVMHIFGLCIIHLSALVKQINLQGQGQIRGNGYRSFWNHVWKWIHVRESNWCGLLNFTHILTKRKTLDFKCRKVHWFLLECLLFNWPHKNKTIGF